jgi:hypothetical protein
MLPEFSKELALFVEYGTHGLALAAALALLAGRLKASLRRRRGSHD